MAETRAVKNDDPIPLRRQVYQATRQEILNHAAIAMQQHERFSGALLYIVKPNTIDIAELSRWRVITHCLVRQPTVSHSGRGQQPNQRRGGRIWP
jgi:hypothetical protein